MNKNIYIGLGSIGLMMLAVILAFPMMAPNMTLSDSPTWKATVCPTIERADGSIEKLECASNLLTNLGKNFTAEVISGEDITGAVVGTDYAKYISLSTNSGGADASWLVLPGEITSGGCERIVGALSTNGVGNFSVWKQFTASATHTAIHLAGLNWNTTGNSLVAANALSSDVNLENGDKLTINWTVSIS